MKAHGTEIINDFFKCLFPLFSSPRKRVTTISSGSDVPITQPLLQQSQQLQQQQQQQQQRVTSTGTLTDDLRPQSILKQQPPTAPTTAENLYQQQDRRSLYSSNKSLNNDYANGQVVAANNVINCQQHNPKCAAPATVHDHECFADNLRHASMITHSNSELNQICPHGKGSSKSE